MNSIILKINLSIYLPIYLSTYLPIYLSIYLSLVLYHFLFCRFMICCDSCGEWYHGMCVGVTRKQGREMDSMEQKWACPECKLDNWSGKAHPREDTPHTRPSKGTWCYRNQLYQSINQSHL